MTKTALRIANEARDKEWMAGKPPLTKLFRLCELGGEVGEALNCIKKLERDRLGIVGSKSSKAALADELADIVICVDLALMTLGQPSIEVAEQFSGTPRSSALDFIGAQMFISAGDLALCIHEGAEYATYQAANNLLRYVHLAFAQIGFDVEASVRAKFNATSVNNNLQTRLA